MARLNYDGDRNQFQELSMGRINSPIVLNEFAIGSEYSRHDVARLGGLPVPSEIYGTAWADGILELENAVILFVTLEKVGPPRFL